MDKKSLSDLIGFVFLLALFVGTISAKTNETRNIGSRRELFVDDYLIDSLKNTHLKLHPPHDEGPAFYFDKSWEGAFSGYNTILQDGEHYLAFYRGLPDVKNEDQIAATCVAISTDGIHWEKPELDLYPMNGQTRNNVILHHAGQATHNFCPFLDTRPGVPAAEKFKALGGTEKSGLIAYSSPDGIHWQKMQEAPVFTRGMFDSQNVAFWSALENCYVLYFRTWTGTGYRGFRTVSRTTSPDFLNWSAPLEMSYGNTPQEHIYIHQTHAYFRAPHIYVAIAARFMPNRQVISDAQALALNVNPKYFKDCSDGVLMTSRGGTVYTRTFMEAFIRPGIGLQNWVSRTNYPALGVIQTGKNEMSVFVGHDYAQDSAHLRRYSMRLDGFISVNAPYTGGELITQPLTFQGRHLFLNYATSAPGEIRVEILDESGKPVPGFSLADSVPTIGNEIEREVSWKNGSDLSGLVGKSIRLRVVMKDADLYAIQFK
jgi:hypothetical protein